MNTQRIAARIIFANMRDAHEAADKLEEAGYEVAISHDHIAKDNGDWLGESTAFAEAYKDAVGADAFACMAAVMDEVTRIIKPFRDGMCVGAYPIDPATHVPFAFIDEYEDIRL